VSFLGSRFIGRRIGQAGAGGCAASAAPTHRAASVSRPARYPSAPMGGGRARIEAGRFYQLLQHESKVAKRCTLHDGLSTQQLHPRIEPSGEGFIPPD